MCSGVHTTYASVHIRAPTYSCMSACVHVYITDYLSGSQMTGLLIRNDAETIGDSWEKSQKPKVQKGNASIKIFIKTIPFTPSSVTDDLLLLVGLNFLPTDTHTNEHMYTNYLRHHDLE